MDRAEVVEVDPIRADSDPALTPCAAAWPARSACQRLHVLRFVDELPRSPIGKVLKRELRAGWMDQPTR